MGSGSSALPLDFSSSLPDCSELHSKQQLYLKKSNQTMSEVVASLAKLKVAEDLEDEEGGAGDSDDE